MSDPINHIVTRFDDELNEIETRLVEMGGLVETQIEKAVRAVVENNKDLADEVRKDEMMVNKLERQIDESVVRFLALRQPMALDLRSAICALKMAGVLERVGDYARSMVQRRSYIHKEFEVDLPFTSIKRMTEMVLRMLKDGLDAFVERDLERAIAVWQRDEEVDAIYISIFRELLTYMVENPRNITPGMNMLFIAKNLERTGDHVTNMAEQIHFRLTGEALDEAKIGSKEH